MAVVLPTIARDAIASHAEASFPEEACGLIFGSGAALRVVPMENIQNRLHREDRGAHPRDATTAYYFDPRAMLQVLAEHEKAGIPLWAIYHSHPNGRAYLSETDRKVATDPWGEGPMIPAQQLVVGIDAQRVVEAQLFAWDEAERGFVLVATLPGMEL